MARFNSRAHITENTGVESQTRLGSTAGPGRSPALSSQARRALGEAGWVVTGATALPWGPRLMLEPTRVALQ